MGINLDKPQLWKDDIKSSVDLYNAWFMEFAPKAFRETRASTAKSVELALQKTEYLRDISVVVLEKYPEVLPILRMSTCPPIARDRLIGLAGVSKTLVLNMENNERPHISSRMKKSQLSNDLQKISDIITKMIDSDIFTWLQNRRLPDETEIMRSSTIVADRLCGAVADPIIRNAQEKRQLAAIASFLEKNGYKLVKDRRHYNEMPPGTFSFHTNVPVFVSENAGDKVNIPVDVVVMPVSAKEGDIPLFIEAKSAGDFANVNKRRKEEAVKMQQLKNTFGNDVSYSLFLCGYFDSGYLGYEAAEGIDWIWEHRITDLKKLKI
ncbi:XamI family restriction endonuclease [Treponema sp. UBA753]|uniref:XamI family restriction endonuclease n=1 Tax=Treponema sp. UBA753 TaxID=1947747 RepID=UPI0025E515EF|nr:XamI family restriction endonuclease [Treponema sp. UBA753]